MLFFMSFWRVGGSMAPANPPGFVYGGSWNYFTKLKLGSNNFSAP